MQGVGFEKKNYFLNPQPCASALACIKTLTGFVSALSKSQLSSTAGPDSNLLVGAVTLDTQGPRLRCHSVNDADTAADVPASHSSKLSVFLSGQ